MRRAYEGQQRGFELAIRLLDQAFEQVVAPSAAIVASRGVALTGILARKIRDAKPRTGSSTSGFPSRRSGWPSIGSSESSPTTIGTPSSKTSRPDEPSVAACVSSRAMVE